MSGAWINAALETPRNADPVLCVKQLQSGRREICIGHWHADLREYDYKAGKLLHEGRWVTTGGNNNVIFWMPLPKIPEVKP